MTNPPHGRHNSGAQAAQPMSTAGKPRRLRRPLSIVLVIACVLAVGVAALLAGELYMRHRASSVNHHGATAHRRRRSRAGDRRCHLDGFGSAARSGAANAGCVHVASQEVADGYPPRQCRGHQQWPCESLVHPQRDHPTGSPRSMLDGPGIDSLAGAPRRASCSR